MRKKKKTQVGLKRGAWDGTLAEEEPHRNRHRLHNLALRLGATKCFTTCGATIQSSEFIIQRTCPIALFTSNQHYRHHKHRIPKNRTITISTHGPLPSQFSGFLSFQMENPTVVKGSRPRYHNEHFIASVLRQHLVSPTMILGYTDRDRCHGPKDSANAAGRAGGPDNLAFFTSKIQNSLIVVATCERRVTFACNASARQRIANTSKTKVGSRDV